MFSPQSEINMMQKQFFVNLTANIFILYISGYGKWTEKRFNGKQMEKSEFIRKKSIFIKYYIFTNTCNVI